MVASPPSEDLGTGHKAIWPEARPVCSLSHFRGQDPKNDDLINPGTLGQVAEGEQFETVLKGEQKQI